MTGAAGFRVVAGASLSIAAASFEASERHAAALKAAEHTFTDLQAKCSQMDAQLQSELEKAAETEKTVALLTEERAAASQNTSAALEKERRSRIEMDAMLERMQGLMQDVETCRARESEHEREQARDAERDTQIMLARDKVKALEALVVEVQRKSMHEVTELQRKVQMETKELRFQVEGVPPTSSGVLIYYRWIYDSLGRWPNLRFKMANLHYAFFTWDELSWQVYDGRWRWTCAQRCLVLRVAVPLTLSRYAFWSF